MEHHHRTSRDIAVVADPKKGATKTKSPKTRRNLRKIVEDQKIEIVIVKIAKKIDHVQESVKKLKRKDRKNQDVSEVGRRTRKRKSDQNRVKLIDDVIMMIKKERKNVVEAEHLKEDVVIHRLQGHFDVVELHQMDLVIVTILLQKIFHPRNEMHAQFSACNYHNAFEREIWKNFSQVLEK